MPQPLLALLIGAGVLLILFILFLPEKGLVARWQKMRRLTERVLREDALKFIHECEINQRPFSVDSLSGSLGVSREAVLDVLARLEKHGLIEVSPSGFRLTPEGRDYALKMIRAHRILERYLADETGFSADEWHDRAHEIEHQLTLKEIQDISNRLGNPMYDPHGDPIPTAEGEIKPHQGITLTSLPVDTPARIVHLEDEPHVVYAQLVAEDIHPGMEVRVVELSPQRVRFWGDGEEHVLAPIVAQNISVRPIEEQAPEPIEPGEPLSNLKPGEKALILRISPHIRGAERRRLMDLGMLPGTLISAEMVSPSGDPTAYRIRGALIALRREQATRIRVKKVQGEGEDLFIGKQEKTLEATN